MEAMSPEDIKRITNQINGTGFPLQLGIEHAVTRLSDRSMTGPRTHGEFHTLSIIGETNGPVTKGTSIWYF